MLDTWNIWNKVILVSMLSQSQNKKKYLNETTTMSIVSLNFYKKKGRKKKEVTNACTCYWLWPGMLITVWVLQLVITGKQQVRKIKTNIIKQKLRTLTVKTYKY